MIESTVRLLYYPIVATLLLALFIRRPGSERKRMAVLGWAGLLLALRAQRLALCAAAHSRLRCLSFPSRPPR